MKKTELFPTLYLSWRMKILQKTVIILVFKLKALATGNKSLS